MLLVLWYTSKAFVPTFVLSGKKIGYFEFVIIGEIFILAPLSAIHCYTKTLRVLLIEKMFDHFLLLNKPLYFNLFVLHLGPFAIEFMRWIILVVIGYIMVPDSIPLLQCLSLLAMQLAVLPIFWALGQIACAFIIRFGRGQNIITVFMTISAILSGVYFPTQVLPVELSSFFDRFSPFNLTLNLSREVLSSGWRNADLMTPLLSLLLWALVLVPLSICLLNYSVHAYRKQGRCGYLPQ